MTIPNDTAPGKRRYARKGDPCPVCEGEDACSVGADGLIFCRRRHDKVPGFVYYGRAGKDEQWGQFRREDDPVAVERERQYQERRRHNGREDPWVQRAQGPSANGHAGGNGADWEARHRRCVEALTPDLLDELAEALGLPHAALRALEVGWSAEDEAWTFPERNDQGKVVGLLRRYRNGSKKAMHGGGRGLNLPVGWEGREGPVLLAEGPTDTATLVALGLCAVGRPSNTGGVEHLARLLAEKAPDREILVAGENDPNRKGEWPGRDGAQKTATGLAARLGRPLCWCLPPTGHKDVRAWVLARGLPLDGEGCADAWDVAGDELLADLRENSVSVSPLGDGTDTESPPSFALIPCSGLRAVPEEALWLWEGFLGRGVVTLLSALMKAGKTTLLAWLLKALTTGGKFLGRDGKPCRVLYVAEEPQTKWAERRDKLGLADHITFIVRPFARKPDRAQWAGFLDHLRRVQERERFDLIVFDTISNLWPVRDENDAAEVQEALMPLHAVIGEAALLLVHHLRKSDGPEGTGSRGSGALLGWVDIIVELRRFDPADLKNTRRELTGYGRYEQTPAKLVVSLGKDGYAVEGGDRAEVRAKDINAALEKVMPAGPPGKTVDEMTEDWPGEAGPNRNDLFAVLKEGLRTGRWGRTGEGKRGDPHRYHRLCTNPPGTETGGGGANAEKTEVPDSGPSTAPIGAGTETELPDSGPLVDDREVFPE
jgi:hypothetical protein